MHDEAGGEVAEERSAAVSYLDAVRDSFDTVAADYARLVEPMLETAAEVREELAAFADRVREDGLGPVADLDAGRGTSRRSWPSAASRRSGWTCRRG